MRKILVLAFAAATLGIGASALAHGPGGYGGGPMMGPGMMGGYGGGWGGGPGMMGGCGAGWMMGPGMAGCGSGGGYGPGGMMQGYGPGMMMGYGGGYYGNQGNLNLSADQVKSYLQQMIRNPNLKVGDVKEKDADTIVAEIVTKDKDVLVQRLVFNRHNGFMQPEQ
ncbi:MAG: hypothetical protein JSR61_15160 [Proteobacteria bacterium]|nr:hypothetical protein [Pseudomonadota bacterium]